MKFGIIAFSAIIITVLWATAIAYFRFAEQRQIEYTYRTNDNLSSAFAAHTAQALREVEGLLRVVAVQYRNAGRRFNLKNFAEEARINSDLIIALIILDREGNVIEASTPDYKVKSHADREHFKVHIDNDSDHLYSSSPVLGRYAKTQVLPFSLRISGPHDEFIGVVVAGVNPKHFIDLYRKTIIGNSGAVSFFGLDGFIRARITAGEIGVGQDVRKARMIKVANENESGRLLFTALTDKITRLYSYQRVPGYPLAIAVGQAQNEALAETRRITNAVLISCVVITLLVMGATILLVSGVNRERKILISLAKRSQDLNHANEEQQSALKNLRLAQAQMVQSEKMAALGGLVAGVAHEINTPIGIGVTAASYFQMTVRNANERYRAGQLTRSEMDEFLKLSSDAAEMVLTNLNRAADLIRSFKQVAVDQSSEEQRQFGVKTYLEEVLVSLAPMLKKTRHVVDIRCPDDLRVFSHPGAFSQIVANLVINSVTHGFEGVAQGHIAIEIGAPTDGLMLRYTDDGKGIAPEHIAKIFDPFFTTKRGQGGSGLGMHIVYNLVTQTLGGTISCKSTPGKGVCFEINMPPSQAVIAVSNSASPMTATVG